MATSPQPERDRAEESLGEVLQGRVGRRFDLQCAGCGYGVVSSSQPPRCPMCGGEVWDVAPRHLFPTRAALTIKAEPLALRR